MTCGVCIIRYRAILPHLLFSYTGHNNMSNMAILDIKFLSGFAVSREALDSVSDRQF